MLCPAHPPFESTVEFMELSPIVEGPEGAPVLFFIQGWPDDASVWDPQVEALRDRYRCVRVNLPNYGDGPRARWGWNTAQIVEALTDCIRRVSPDAPVTLVLHDWGAFWGYILHNRHPELANRVVGTEVEPHSSPTWIAWVMVILYQGWLWLAFYLGRPVGDWMSRLIAGMLQAPQPLSNVRGEMNYPYRNVWLDLFAGRTRTYTKGYWPQVPLLFAYGTQKPFEFHSAPWVEHVKSVPGGEVLPIDCGHWLQPEAEFTQRLQAWLERTDALLQQSPPQFGRLPTGE